MSEVVKERLVRPKRNTNLYRKNQKCWVKFVTGSHAICVKGKYRGKGRYVEGWLHIPRDCEYSDVKEIEITKEQAKRLGLLS